MQYANVPEELKVLPQWVVYRLVDYVDKNGKKRKTRYHITQLQALKQRQDNPKHGEGLKKLCRL